MDCDFSEFSYGYAAIREAESELAAIYKAAGAPVLPSLVAEEKLGWDAKLGFVEYALFLQFKRIEYVSREHPASPTWWAVGGPHYRFSIDTDGHQHRALTTLESNLAAGSDPGHVYYAAPGFHRQQEFDEAYSLGQVLDRSHILPPRELGLGTGKHHLVSDMHGGCADPFGAAPSRGHACLGDHDEPRAEASENGWRPSSPTGPDLGTVRGGLE